MPNKKEQLAEKIALLLYPLHVEDQAEVANAAIGLAYRARRAKTDPTWWELAGRPAYNQQLKRIRKKIERKR